MDGDVLTEIAVLSSNQHDPVGDAAEVLRLLGQEIPYAAATISVWNPLTREHQTLVNDGYPDLVMRHLNTAFVARDPAYLHMIQHDTTPLSWRTAPGNYRETFSAQEIFVPAGYDEGVTAVLHTRDGRYTGSLHISTDERRHPTDDALALLRPVQRMLAGMVDQLRSPAEVVATIDRSAPAAAVTVDGRVVTLPGRDPGPHLVPGSSLLGAIVSALRQDALPARFRWHDGAYGWHLVHTHRVGPAAVVTVLPDALPDQVTSREVEVLSLVARGYTNPQIAERLFVSTKTVAKHLEHVLEKLGVASRTGAAVAAVERGLIQLPEPSARDRLTVPNRWMAVDRKVTAPSRGLRAFERRSAP